MGGIVNELLQQGFVEKSPDLSDGRREFVAITSDGVKTMALVNLIRDRDLAALLDRQLDDRERGLVQEALSILESLGADGS
jgi:DNA-binding MarR family transcriptional regulator